MDVRPQDDIIIGYTTIDALPLGKTGQRHLNYSDISSIILHFCSHETMP